MTTKTKKETTEKIKVSTGAWWKSAPAEEEKQQSSSAESPATRASSKATKKKTTKASPAPSERSEGAGESQPQERTDEKTDTPKKASRRGRSRSSQAKKAPSSTEELLPASLVSQDNGQGKRQVVGGESGQSRVAEVKPTEPIEKSGKEQGDSPAEEGEESFTAKKKTGRQRRQSSQNKERGEKSVPEKRVTEETVSPEEAPKRSLKLLINAEEPEECRLALLEDGRLESIHVSTVSKEQRKNNIYKAKVVAVEPSLQAAFVDYGTEKNGFLSFSEIHPEYFKTNLPDKVKELVEKQQWKRLSITDVVEKGQELLVQVVKEEVGKKGANMTTFLSIPGRCVVLMPGSDSAGISRKISGEERRGQLREIMQGFGIPQGVGWIVRTASVDISENALSRDVAYLLKLWADIRQKGQEMRGVGLLYEDHKTVSRFLREHFDPAIEEILVDDRMTLEEVKEFIEMLPEVQQNVRVRLHQGARPIFNQYSVEDQLESIYQPQVNLPSGGSIVINPTEALVAVDVNSGSTSKDADFEESIFQANLEAATELARQLRLRDLGGLVVVDFIDMRSRKHINALEKQMKQAMKRDKAKVDFSRISKFGLLQISRQKLGAPVESGNYRICEYCKGRGTLRSVETLSLFYLRRIQTGASRKAVEQVECHFPMDVASYLLNHKRIELSEMEKRYQVEIHITARARMKPADNEIIFHKKDNKAKEEGR